MAVSKKKAGWIGTGITTLGGVATAIAVPLVQKIDKEEDVMATLHKSLLELTNRFNDLNREQIKLTHDLVAKVDEKFNNINREQSEKTHELVAQLNETFNKLVEDIRKSIMAIWHKIHEVEIMVRTGDSDLAAKTTKELHDMSLALNAMEGTIRIIQDHINQLVNQ